tara:strand:- start:620 stop:1348 length:729 start_codon:yes stop_codon:yes gene_type:complete
MQEVIKPYLYVSLSELREIVVKPSLLLGFLVQIILSVFFVTLGAIDQWMTSEPISWFVILVLNPVALIRMVILIPVAFRSTDRFMTDLILVRGISRLGYFVGKIAAIYTYFVLESLIFVFGVAYFSIAFSAPEANDTSWVGLSCAYIIVLVSFGFVGSILSVLSASGLSTVKTLLIFFLILVIVLLFSVLVGFINAVPENIFRGYGDTVRGLTDLSFSLMLLFFVSLANVTAAYAFFARRDF